MRPTPLLRLRPTSSLRMRPTQPRRMPQDMPPQGGYAPVQYKRNLPAKGFKPFYYILGMGAIMTYGFWQYAAGVREWNELARERMWARIHLIPLLSAEDDRDQVRRYYADKEREKKLLGGEMQVYHGDRFVRPTFTLTPHVSKNDDDKGDEVSS